MQHNAATTGRPVLSHATILLFYVTLLVHIVVSKQFKVWHNHDPRWNWPSGGSPNRALQQRKQDCSIPSRSGSRSRCRRRLQREHYIGHLLPEDSETSCPSGTTWTWRSWWDWWWWSAIPQEKGPRWGTPSRGGAYWVRVRNSNGQWTRYFRIENHTIPQTETRKSSFVQISGEWRFMDEIFRGKKKSEISVREQSSAMSARVEVCTRQKNWVNK